MANDEHFLHRNKHETTRGRGFFHLFLMSSALSVGKLLLWNLFSFPFSDSTARSPDIHQNYSSLGLFFYDVSLERKTALRRWNKKVIQLWGAFSCATERTRIGTPLIIFGKKPSPSLAHTRTLFNGGGGFGFTHAIFFSPQQNGIPSNVGDLGWIFFSSFTSTRR